MPIKPQTEPESLLISNREVILERIEKLFRKDAVESHLFGSLARGDSDAYSDIDIWFTFPNEDIKEILAHRFEYYAQIGEILHIYEPPQNAPLHGVQTSVTYETTGGYLVVDYSLCPLSTAYSVSEARTLFGMRLPIKTMEYNPQKVQVNESYRIDFLIGFTISAIKKLLRRQDKPLDALFNEYQYLPERYGIALEPLHGREQSFALLKKIIENIRKVADGKQQKMLDVVSNFIIRVEADRL